MKFPAPEIISWDQKQLNRVCRWIFMNKLVWVRLTYNETLKGTHAPCYSSWFVVNWRREPHIISLRTLVASYLLRITYYSEIIENQGVFLHLKLLVSMVTNSHYALIYTLQFLHAMIFINPICTLIGNPPFPISLLLIYKESRMIFIGCSSCMSQSLVILFTLFIHVV